jgi:glycosyltransferase involved in cell wall biosynthesis
MSSFCLEIRGFPPVLQKDQQLSDCVAIWRQDTSEVRIKRLVMIGVVIPVHNEAALLGECLEAMARAAGEPRLDHEPVDVVVVLDACTDRSAAVAVRHGAQIVSLDARCVGAARALGASFALDSGARWIACTDADTIVPPDWLAGQLATGADAACGPVGIADWSTHPFGVRERFLQHYGALGECHIHGANLGISAAAYRKAGGFKPLHQGEDTLLIASLVECGGRVAWNGCPRVTTNARWEGPIEGGFASLLRDLREASLAEVAAAAPVAA